MAKIRVCSERIFKIYFKLSQSALLWCLLTSCWPKVVSNYKAEDNTSVFHFSPSGWWVLCYSVIVLQLACLLSFISMLLYCLSLSFSLLNINVLATATCTRTLGYWCTSWDAAASLVVALSVYCESHCCELWRKFTISSLYTKIIFNFKSNTKQGSPGSYDLVLSSSWREERNFIKWKKIINNSRDDGNLSIPVWWE